MHTFKQSVLDLFKSLGGANTEKETFRQVSTHTYVYVSMYVCMCIYVCMYVCMYVCV